MMQQIMDTPTDKVSAYLQLEYTGLKDYPILNHPGGIP